MEIRYDITYYISIQIRCYYIIYHTFPVENESMTWQNRFWIQIEKKNLPKRSTDQSRGTFLHKSFLCLEGKTLYFYLLIEYNCWVKFASYTSYLKYKWRVGNEIHSLLALGIWVQRHSRSSDRLGHNLWRKRIQDVRYSHIYHLPENELDSTALVYLKNN